MSKPLAIDLFCGLGGWAEGFLAEGYDVVGFDIERHRYAVPEWNDAEDGCKNTRSVEKRGWTQSCAVALGLEGVNARPRTRILQYPGLLVLQDVLTLDGAQFKDAAVIVASPPCQAYSYRAMPWKRAKALPPPSNELFDACFRIQREASAAARRYIPLIVENVRGACPWVGQSRWHYGSFHLWGDVPALMPMTESRPVMKQGIAHRSNGATNFHGVKGISGRPTGHWTNPAEHKTCCEFCGYYFAAQCGRYGCPNCEGRGLEKKWQDQHSKQEATKVGGDWFETQRLSHPQYLARTSRKAASAQIAKIPFPLARHIARCFKPVDEPVQPEAVLA